MTGRTWSALANGTRRSPAYDVSIVPLDAVRTRSESRVRLSRSFLISQLLELIRRQPKAVAVVAVSAAVAGLSESGILAVLAQAAAGLVNHTTKVRLDLGLVHTKATLGQLLLAGLALAVLRLLLQLVISDIPARITDATQARLRTTLFAAFSRSSWDEQSRDREGHLQELLTNQVTQATLSVLQTMTLVFVLPTFLVLVIAALALNVVAAVLVLVTAVGLSLLLRPLGSLGNRGAEAVSNAYLAYAGGVNEAVRLAEETQVFGAEAAQRERTDHLIEAMRSPNYYTLFLTRLVPGIYQSLIYLLLVGALAVLYALGATEVASLGAVVLLLVRAGAYGQQAQSCFQYLRQAQPYIERLAEAEQRYAASSPTAGSRRLNRVESLAFDRVSFAYYPDRPTLTDIDFSVIAGESVGIIGPSGAGKSTLVQILLRLRTPGSGTYLVNDVPADEFLSSDWRERIAYVPQEPRLLHGTVTDNIRFFRPIDQASVERAARLAGIHDAVAGWPSGYDTIIGPRADAISGGQQQRICLARALAANPEVLVLDEPTSALDPRAEQLLQDSLRAIKHQVTLFIVAHRMSTLDVCDRVMVVVDGSLDAFDTAEALQLENPYYRSAVAHGFPAPLTAPLIPEES